MSELSNNIPVVQWAHPKPEEVWRVYLGDKVKVRELNDGRIQVATGFSEWVDV